MSFSSLQLESIHLKDFRCFDQKELMLSSAYVLIEGANGIGKTSILEAIYYGCFLRSFRTHVPKELMRFGTDTFFLKIHFSITQDERKQDHELQVGFSKGRRLVKLNGKTINSFKDLLAIYKVVSLTEDDLALVKGAPHDRRFFIDHTLMLLDPSVGQELRTYRQIVSNRNALLAQRKQDNDMYMILTEQLWQQAVVIMHKRKELIEKLFDVASRFLHEQVDQSYSLHADYQEKRPYKETFDEFTDSILRLKQQEYQFGRSLFGAHLDDISIYLSRAHSRHYASRGQQKLIVLLIKIALLELLHEKGYAAVFLLDDFMTDFDKTWAQAFVSLLLSRVRAQLVFTSPLTDSPLHDLMRSQAAGHIIQLNK